MNLAALEAYINRFYGYGNWNFDTWFVGIEEGGCSSVQDFEKRLVVWQKRGCLELEDARPYHEEIGLTGLTRWFGKYAHLQPTWKELIRIYLSLQGEATDKESVRKYQSEKFGTKDSGFASLELFSLPSTNAVDWIYGDIAGLPYLINREVYQYYLYPRRAEELRRRIQIHKPKRVIIYSKGHQSAWEGIIMKKFEKSALPQAVETMFESTFIIVIPHPVARGYDQSYWIKVGEYLKSKN